MKSMRGFTLMELLVVLLIIGVLSTVALRTIDATRDRGLFEQTSREMRQLVHAMTGNPELFANGQRVDFGFYGDMRRLPNDLRELVYNTSGSSSWRGPYLRREFTGDTAGYLYDGWGNPYTYDYGTGTIASLGNGKYPITVRVSDSIVHLSDNTVVGNIADADNAPPGEMAPSIGVYIYHTNGDSLMHFTTPDKGGYYEFSPRVGRPVPVGGHKIKVVRPAGDSIVRWVTVVPRSKSVVDFRFSQPFRSRLVQVGPTRTANDSSGFAISVVCMGAADDTVRWIKLLSVQDSAHMFMGRLYINSLSGGMRDVSYAPPLKGQGDTMTVFPSYLVLANAAEEVEFGFYDFFTDPNGPPNPKANVRGKQFRLLFSDGSEIGVTP
uniref:Prepilin-type N-terminal cleavage/methylation domain-containing protein n=1 Tax=candidate division WOR-3 bacterium TaxID=2052148 RepID=A0A7C4GFF9_UNCW3